MLLHLYVVGQRHNVLYRSPEESVIRAGHESLVVAAPATFKLIEDTVVFV